MAISRSANRVELQSFVYLKCQRTEPAAVTALNFLRSFPFHPLRCYCFYVVAGQLRFAFPAFTVLHQPVSIQHRLMTLIVGEYLSTLLKVEGNHARLKHTWPQSLRHLHEKQ